MRRKLGIGELLDVKEFVTPAGDQPVEHTPIICGECGYRVGLHEANDDFVQENTGA